MKKKKKKKKDPKGHNLSLVARGNSRTLPIMPKSLLDTLFQLRPSTHYHPHGIFQWQAKRYFQNDLTHSTRPKSNKVGGLVWRSSQPIPHSLLQLSTKLAMARTYQMPPSFSDLSACPIQSWQQRSPVPAVLFKSHSQWTIALWFGVVKHFETHSKKLHVNDMEVHRIQTWGVHFIVK